MMQNGKMSIVSAVMALATITCLSTTPARANGGPARQDQDNGRTRAPAGSTSVALEMAAQTAPTSRIDRATTRQVRRAIMADRGLSMFAHRVSIITQGGNVTLRGIARTEAEHQALLAKAASVTGSAVVDEITVLP
jgi:hyperosmotically inducible periplasmic protein